MVNTGVFKLYLLILIFFNFFAGSFNLNNNDDAFEVNKFFIVSNIRSNLDNADNVFSNILKIVLAPFILIDAVIFMLVVVGLGISVLPPIIEILMFTPLGLFVIFDYIIPAVRGN